MRTRTVVPAYFVEYVSAAQVVATAATMSMIARIFRISASLECIEQYDRAGGTSPLLELCSNYCVRVV
jgi:hypothetical protein